MKTTAVISALFAAASLNAAVIEQVIVRQQWPWSTDVKVEYKVSGVTSPVNIGVRAFNGDTELDSSNLEASISGERYGIAEDGVGTFVIDPVKAFGTSKVALANFKVKLSLTPAAANINEVIYKVFDLTTGACKNITRADFYNGKVEDGDFVTDYTSLNSQFLAPNSEMVGDVLIWTGVTNNVKYKTTHLVMRKIPAANKIWAMGAPPTEPGYQESTETNHLVKLTRNYYMGVFEITQKQYTLIVGNNPSTGTTREDADVLPVNKLFYGNLDANNNNTACEFAKRMRTKAQNVNFCLPTEAQWEFACRAGSGTALYSGRFVSEGGLWSGCDGQANPLAWFGGENATQGNSAIDGVLAQHPVGRKLPNAFGLYDMYGNVLEFTTDLLNTGSAYISTFGTNWQPGDVVVDPNVTATGSKFVLRGGSYSKAAVYCRSGCRRLSLGRWDTPSNDNGMRIALMEE